MDRCGNQSTPRLKQLVAAVPLDPFMSLRALSTYSGLSVRNLRGHLNASPALPHYRVGGKILVRRSEFDAWMGRFRVDRSVDVDAIVREVVDGLGCTEVQR